MMGKPGEGTAANAAMEPEIDAVLAEFGGDARAAIRALLHDIGVLAFDSAAASCGYLRRQQPPPPSRVLTVRVTERKAAAGE